MPDCAPRMRTLSRNLGRRMAARAFMRPVAASTPGIIAPQSRGTVRRAHARTPAFQCGGRPAGRACGSPDRAERTNSLKFIDMPPSIPVCAASEGAGWDSGWFGEETQKRTQLFIRLRRVRALSQTSKRKTGRTPWHRVAPSREVRLMPPCAGLRIRSAHLLFFSHSRK